MSPTTQTRPPADAALVRRPPGVRAVWVVGALALLALAIAASVTLGARSVGWADIVSAFTGGDGVAEAAIRQRIPRTLLAMLVGAALAVAATAMQGATRNPLADPGLLGISSGAALAVVVGIVFLGLSSPSSYIWVAILGSAAAGLLVWSVGSLGRGGATPLKLTLAGAAVWASSQSLVSAILLPRIDVMTQFRFWQIGGVGGASDTRILQVLPFLVVGFGLSFLLARGLNSLALGDDVAAGLGAHVGTVRLLAGLGAVILAGAATAVAGPIAFIGLIVSHLCRLLIGVDHRWLLPFTAVVGAALLTAADVLGRVVARPEEIDVGIVTAFIGAPVFIWVVRRQKVRAL